MGIQLFRCERMSAMISREQCDRNRYGVRGATYRGTIPPRWACEGCPGLDAGVVAIHDAKESSMANKQCAEPGCTKFAVAGGYCWKHAKKHGIDPKTGKKMSASRAAATVVDSAPLKSAEGADEGPLPLPDPRETYECPHCGCALSSNEVDLPTCPLCEGLLHTHVDQAGVVFTPAAETADDFCTACGTYPCSCAELGGGTYMHVSDILPDGRFEVEPPASEERLLDGRVTNMDGERVEFGVDAVVVMAIREALRDLEASMLMDLSGLTPGRMICETYRKLERIQTLRG